MIDRAQFGLILCCHVTNEELVLFPAYPVWEKVFAAEKSNLKASYKRKGISGLNSPVEDISYCGVSDQ